MPNGQLILTNIRLSNEFMRFHVIWKQNHFFPVSIVEPFSTLECWSYASQIKSAQHPNHRYLHIRRLLLKINDDIRSPGRVWPVIRFEILSMENHI